MVPPRSSLFPYTTLFRSEDLVGGRRVAVAARVSDDDHLELEALRRVDRQQADGVGALLLRDRLELAGADGLDRKSTRLNSSHMSISYAVFCLKKKNPNVH